jgi:hypothetical protein
VNELRHAYDPPAPSTRTSRRSRARPRAVRHRVPGRGHRRASCPGPHRPAHRLRAPLRHGVPDRRRRPRRDRHRRAARQAGRPRHRRGHLQPPRAARPRGARGRPGHAPRRPDRAAPTSTRAPPVRTTTRRRRSTSAPPYIDEASRSRRSTARPRRSPLSGAATHLLSLEESSPRSVPPWPRRREDALVRGCSPASPRSAGWLGVDGDRVVVSRGPATGTAPARGAARRGGLRCHGDHRPAVRTDPPTAC